MPAKKTATKRATKPKVVKVPLEKITEVIFTKDGEEYQLVPFRPWGNYNLRRVPK